MTSSQRGRFITLEGIDGAGKSTAVPVIERVLRDHGHEALVTREPGGTPLGERLREILLGLPMAPETEALVVFAARSEHIARVIEPALASGRWVLCDRFTDATMAYQGSGRGIALERLEVLETWVQGSLRPDLTLLFDVPVDVGRARSGAVRVADRIEAQADAFFQRVRQGYLQRARAAADRVRIIDAARGIDDVKKQVEESVTAYCSK